MSAADPSLVLLGAPVLREKARAIVAETDLAPLIASMREAMRARDGIGIAAPQVGKSLRLFLVARDLLEEGARAALPTDVFVNPKIVRKSFRREVAEEGCLSVPAVFGEVRRCARVALEASDLSGKRFRVPAEGLLARVFQHELDHLDGVLFIDRADGQTLREAAPDGALRPWQKPPNT